MVCNENIWHLFCKPKLFSQEFDYRKKLPDLTRATKKGMIYRTTHFMTAPTHPKRHFGTYVSPLTGNV